MATDYSRMIFFFNIIITIMILIATVLCFLAPNYIVTPTNAATSVSSNNQTASNFFYVAGAIGAVITVIFVGYFIYSWFTPAVDLNNPESIANAGYGWGTVLFVIILIAMYIFMIFLILYAIFSLNDSSSNAKYWGIAAIVLVAIAFIMQIANIFFYWSYNSYLSSLTKTEEVVSLQAVAKPFPLNDIFLVNRNPKTMNQKFAGTIALKGNVKKDNEFIEYNGRIIENNRPSENEKIDLEFTISDDAMPENIAKPPAKVQKVEVNQNIPVVRSPGRIPVRQQM